MNFQKLGKYTLLEKLASGGMAEIHLAISSGAEGVHKFFAIKKILSDYSQSNSFVEMFKEEARITSQMNHSNIVNIFDFSVDNINEFYIVMEYVHGKNLKQIIQALSNEKKTLPVEFIAYIIQEAASGLDYAHKASDITMGLPLNIIHRDVSPHNIMVSFNGEIKVIDFGVAKSNFKSEKTSSGTLKGKFGYMSPEQVRGETIDRRTDIFSLGIILWELLADTRLFASENDADTFEKIKNGIIPDITQYVDPKYHDLSMIVRRCLTMEKERRFQSGQELSKALNAFLNVHFPDFSKYTFSDYMKKIFYHSYQKSQEKLIKYSQIKTNLDDQSEYVYQSIDNDGSDYSASKSNRHNRSFTGSITSLKNVSFNSNELSDYKEMERKKDLKWIYGLFVAVMVVSIYFSNYGIPRSKDKDSIGFETNIPQIKEISGVGNQGCVQTKNNTTFCWGDNRFHQLGLDTAKEYVSLQEISHFPKWETLQIGRFHSCGITKVKKDNNDNWSALKCWGDNRYGQVGDPSQQIVVTPTTIDPNTEYQSVSIGLYHTCGLTKDGIVRCWGRGDFVQLGLPHIKSSKVPLTIDPSVRFKSISSGAYHTCGIMINNKLRCWGRSEFGQVGNGAITYQGTLQNIDLDTEYTQISLSDFHSCGITVANQVKCWGKNDFGQLGIGSLEPSTSPALVSTHIKFEKVKVGKFHTCAETSQNDLHCWGRNNYFQVTNQKVSYLLKPELLIRLQPQGDFLVGEFSTCFSSTDKLSCRGFHWAQSPRVPAGTAE